MNPRPAAYALFALLGTLVVVVFASSASAQAPSSQAGSTDGRWEIEVHGGGAVGSSPTDGTSSLPAAGEALTTITGDRKSTRLNSSHIQKSRMPSSA